MALTPMQKKFIYEYSKSGNAGDAYLKAGYNAKDIYSANSGASRLLSKANIQMALHEFTKEIKTNAIADSREMQEVLTKIIHEELDEEVLISEGIGEGISQIVKKRKKAALRDRLKAIELLAKMQGAFVDKIQIEGSVPVQFVDDLKE